LEQPVKVRILDHEYLIKSEERATHVQQVAEYVNERFQEIRDHSRGLSETKTAILAAFHIASEYFQAIKERENLLEEIQSRARALNVRIGSVETEGDK